MSEDTSNPYSPPASEPLPPLAAESGEFPLASPWTRFHSVVIDGVVNLGVVRLIRFAFSSAGFPLVWAESGAYASGKNYLLALLGIIVFYAVQSWLLCRSGQTIGKKLTGIRIATMTGGKPSAIDLLLKRYGFSSLLMFIPIVGGIISLVDILSIFRKDRRCLHDQIAGTQVVRVTG
ncbi:RDD family protein [Luteolibacter sp. LG18]|uniref:RDD family protein n=1 Tax=Luteolibacter sp. LG18 TaxID=2819286 RepID=UPI002B31EEE0|nr:hypothetical protein llg_26480 [Luteolibacter sp. LG18]